MIEFEDFSLRVQAVICSAKWDGLAQRLRARRNLEYIQGLNLFGQRESLEIFKASFGIGSNLRIATPQKYGRTVFSATGLIAKKSISYH